VHYACSGVHGDIVGQDAQNLAVRKKRMLELETL